MGGAQPLAATMAGASFLGVEVDPHRVQRRLETRYVDKATESLDEALAWLEQARAAYVEAARAMGQRVLKEGGADDAARAARAHLLAVAREAGVELV